MRHAVAAASMLALFPVVASAQAPADPGDILVTATRRDARVSDVPVALTVASGAQMERSGAFDIRGLDQLVPSLLVSSSSSEAAGAGARIRGIGTVGDNAGLESSVATFVDGVYRSRAGVALTELGPVDSVEVLRGPQGSLFGRNASAGLINITTARPDMDRFGGFLEGDYGNYAYKRVEGGVTGPVADGLALRLDGVYDKREGFMQDVVSGRRIDGHDRWLIRGKAEWKPTSTLSLLVIADYAKRNEECCVGSYLPVRNATRNADGSLTYSPSTVAALEQTITSVVPGAENLILDDTYARKVALTPGETLRQDVRDGGISAQIDWDLGGAKLTSISAYRENKLITGQDGDFGPLDLLVRNDDGSRFTRFRDVTQELRLQGKAFDGRLDWLVGGFFSHEDLTLTDNLGYGRDYDDWVGALTASTLGSLGPAFLATGYPDLNGFARAFAAARGASPAVADAVAAQVVDTPLAGTADRDRFDQTDNSYALFTHDIVKLTDRLSLTLGARYTWDRKSLDANLASDSPCGTYAANVQRLRALAASDPADAAVASGLAATLAPYAGYACVVNSVQGRYSGDRHEGNLSGTAVLSWKPTDRLLTYASYARGYKSGGFNLDRATLYSAATLSASPTADLSVLQFRPETDDAFEVGAKYRAKGFGLNVALFYERFNNFQLNTFNGTSFFVTSIEGCKDDLGSTDSDQIPGNSECAHTKSGVTSKGIEIEALLDPAPDFHASTGFELADARFADDLAGSPDASGNNSLPPALSLLPGGRLSNSSLYTVTGSAAWTPPVGRLRGLLYADFRYSSALNTGSDLFSEKLQPGFIVVNARIGIGTEDGRWTLEGWVRNAFNTNYQQVAFSEPLQGSNTSAAQLSAGQTSTQLFGAFLGEPRTFGLTARTRF